MSNHLNMSEINKIKDKLQKELTPGRFEHTIAVMYTATSMAMRYDADIEKTMYAGLLHDCAKCIPNEEKYKLCDYYGLELNEVEKVNPALLHARLGRYIARDNYGINDEEILQAIERHTTGAPNMSKLDKIIFLADFIEPTRTETDYIKKVRDLAFAGLDKCLKTCLEVTVEYLKSSGKEIDITTFKTYEYYHI